MPSETLQSNYNTVELQDWENKVTTELKGKTPDSLHRRLLDGRIQKILYTSEDCKDMTFPQLRNGDKWKRLSTYVPSESKQLNKQILQDVQGGVSSLSIPASNFWNTSAIDEIFDGVYTDMIDIHVRGLFPEFALATMFKWSQDNQFDFSKMSYFANIDPFEHLSNIGDITKKYSCLGRLFTLSSHNYHMRGATDKTELAIVISQLLWLLRDRDRSIFENLLILIPVDSNFYTSITKIRTLRSLLDKIQNHLGFTDIQSKIPIQAESSMRMMSCIDPFVNVLRTTVAASACVLGGVDHISILPYDRVYVEENKDVDSEMGHRIARNIHSLLDEEVLMGFTKDPTRGSYYFESQTDSLSRAVWEQVQDWERRGGFMSIQNEIPIILSREQLSRNEKIQFAKIQITGVSSFPPTEHKVSSLPSAHFEKELQKEKEWQQARGDINITMDTKYSMDTIQEHVDNGATRQEILRQVSLNIPVYRDVPVKRDSQMYEEIVFSHHICRDNIFLLQVGPLREYAQRKIWIENFLLSGGFSFHEKSHEPTTEVYDAIEIMEQQLQNMSQDTKIILLCAGDPIYKEHGSMIIERIQKTHPKIKIILSGNPHRVGIDPTNLLSSLYSGCNQVETLRTILEVLS